MRTRQDRQQEEGSSSQEEQSSSSEEEDEDRKLAQLYSEPKRLTRSATVQKSQACSPKVPLSSCKRQRGDHGKLQDEEEDEDDEVLDTGLKSSSQARSRGSHYHGRLRSMRGNSNSSSGASEGSSEETDEEGEDNEVGEEEGDGEGEEEEAGPQRRVTRHSLRSQNERNGPSNGSAKGKGSRTGCGAGGKAKGRHEDGGRKGGGAGKSWEGRVVRQLRDRSKLVPLTEQRRRQLELELAAQRDRKRLRHGSERRPSSAVGHNGSGRLLPPAAAAGPSRRAGWGQGSDLGWGRHYLSDDDVMDADGEGGGGGWQGIGAMLGGSGDGSGGAAPWPPLPLIPGTPVQPFNAAASMRGAGMQPPASAMRGSGQPPPWAGGGLLGGSEVGGGPAIKGKERAGNAEITPVQVDPSIDFNQVGGLNHYVRALKEMVFLPLLYPDLFERFKVQPPRGVLFYGPPGTGKTLVARALAAQASQGAGQQVSFFMRKGADVLSKWVGEAERQLRLLFEEAARHAPSIIFFDEIDGLAPVRSSKQDQIHNSIVSTLLALMDGLDPRGKVVVIGATNRVDAIDGALRRPGRFDRELLFPLPNLQARRCILDIHTAKWSQPPSPGLRQELAAHCAGYCGADLKALCAEAALAALRRRYPQIYESNQRLLVDPTSVHVERQDFFTAAASITPSSHRSAAAHAQPLSPVAAPCLAPLLRNLLVSLCATFPPAATCLAAAAQEAAACPSIALPLFGAGEGKASQGPSTSQPLSDPLPASLPASMSMTSAALAAAGPSAMQPTSSLLLPGRHALKHCLLRPRLLLCGPEGSGAPALAAALLSAVEGLPVQGVGLPALLSDPGARSLEEALVHVVVEARRAAPAVLYLPHIQLWWTTAPPSLRAVLVMLLEDLPADTPLLLLATANAAAAGLEPELLDLFSTSDGGQVVELNTPPSASARKTMLEPLMHEAALPPPPPAVQITVAGGQGQRQGQEELAVDLAAMKNRQEEEEARQALLVQQRYEADQAALRALRMGLRDVTLRLLGDRRWRDFAVPVDPEEDPEYWQNVSCPCDLATILAHVDNRHYNTAAAYLAHVALIGKGWREYFEMDEQQHQQQQQQLNGVHAPGRTPPPPALHTDTQRGSHHDIAHAAAPTAPQTLQSGPNADTYTTPAANKVCTHTLPSTAAAQDAPAGVPPHGTTVNHSAPEPVEGPAATTEPVKATTAATTEPVKATTAAEPVFGLAAGTQQPAVLPQPHVQPPPRLVSRAAALYDEAEALLRLRVPLQLMQACEAIVARGGPAPPPPGVQTPEGLASAAMEAAAAAAGEQRRRGGSDSDVAGTAHTRTSNRDFETMAGNCRHSSRLRGEALPQHMVFENPEVILRRSKQLLRPPKAKAGSGSSARSRLGSVGSEGGEVRGYATEARATPEADDGGAEREGVGQQQQQRELAAAAACKSPSPGPEEQPQQGGPLLPPLLLQGVSNNQQHPVQRAGGSTPPPRNSAGVSTSEAAAIGPSAGPVRPGQALLHQHPQPQQQNPLQQAADAAPEQGLLNATQPHLALLPPAPEPHALARSHEVLDQLVQATEGWMLGPLEVLHTQVARAVVSNVCLPDRVAAVASVGETAMAHIRAMQAS